jgi:hypothetical protein
MAAKRISTIGYERKFNYALNLNDSKKFIDSLTHGMPDHLIILVDVPT